jgi:transketolase
MKTIIGQGSKNQGTYKVHGNPLGQEDGLTTKQSYGWSFPDFHVPQEVYDHFATTLQRRGKNRYRTWTKQLRQLELNNPSRYQQFQRGDQLDFISPLPDPFITFAQDYKDATRNTSQAIINVISQHDPLILGGSADVAKSVMTTIHQGGDMSPSTPLGKNIHFGIREFAMASIQNGMMLHRGLRTFTGTFLAFADYMKPAIRLAALSHIPSIFVFSHDSVALGEDGPTHQPIDQLAMLRSIPHIQVFRPGDAKETLGAWVAALASTDTPTVIVLTRQAVPLLSQTDAKLVGQGGYVLIDQPAQWTLVATGSETSLAYQVVQTLQSQYNVRLRLVSMPSVELFKLQTPEVRQAILANPWQRVITLEALSTFGWAHLGQHNLGIDTFGQSAPGPTVMAHFGMSVPAVIEKILALVTSAQAANKL